MQSMGNNHNEQVSPPTTMPAIAYFFDSFLNSAKTPRMSATGGANIMRIPTRDPSGEPQPNPGTPAMEHRIRVHGDNANHKLILLILTLFIF
jgi:hypothetical protein